MEVERILEELQYSKGVFPRKALKEAMNNHESITPELLKIIEHSTQNIDELLEKEKYFAYLFATYLLAQFREKKAYKLLIDFFSIPSNKPLKVTGDLVTEDLGRILASVYDGDISLLKSLIEKENANEYVRSAALETLLVLVVEGIKTREEIINYFKELFESKLVREASMVWNALVARSVVLYSEEVYEDIKKAYDDELVEEFFISFEDVENALKVGKEETTNKLKADARYSLIKDVISELGNWACFR